LENVIGFFLQRILSAHEEKKSSKILERHEPSMLTNAHHPQKIKNIFWQIL
jgi:hypothetical protein